MAQQVDVDLIVEAISKGFDKVAKDLNKVEKAEKDLEKTSSKFSRVAEGVQKNWAAITLGLGAAAGAMVTVKKGWEFSKEGAQILKVRDTFDALTGSIGSTSQAMLTSLRSATEGMVADTDLMMSASRFLSMGLATTSDQASELARIAVSLGGAMGKEATPAMEEFALLLANQSIPRLDTFGISAGKVRTRIRELKEEFPDMTRETAFMTATMEQAEISMKKLGDAVPTDPFTQLEVSISNITADLKVLAGQGLAPVARETDNYISAIKANIDANSILESALKTGLITQKEAEDIMRGQFWTTKQLSEATEELVIFINAAREAQLARGRAVGDSDVILQNYVDTLEDAEEAEAELTEEQEKLIEAMEDYWAQQEMNNRLRGVATDLEIVEEHILWKLTAAQIAETKATEDATQADEDAAVAAEALLDSIDAQGRLFADIAQGGLRFFNEELDELGPKLVMVGGRTTEQNRIFEEAERNYERAGDAIVDYRVGLSGFGMDADKVAEKISDLTDEQAHWTRVMDEFSGEQATANLVVQEATLNYEELNKALFESILALEDEEGHLVATKEQMAEAGLALGIYTDLEVEAIIQTLLITNAITFLSNAMLTQGLSADRAAEALRLVAEGAYETAEAALEAMEEADGLNESLDRMDRTIQPKIDLQITGLAAWQEAARLQAKLGGGQGVVTLSGGAGFAEQAAANPDLDTPVQVPPNTGNVPEFAHGGSFVVPPGFTSDPFLIGVHSGEPVQVTPRGQSSGGGNVTIHINGGDLAEVRRVVSEEITQAGISANRRRRTI